MQAWFTLAAGGGCVYRRWFTAEMDTGIGALRLEFQVRPGWIRGIMGRTSGREEKMPRGAKRQRNVHLTLRKPRWRQSNPAGNRNR